jgi:DNA invertase Pin-like site-specific DNA recombinase
MSAKQNVIYCRFSPEMQRVESNIDQERGCRDDLHRKEIDDGDFRVICDEALKGTNESRLGFVEVKDLIDAGNLGILIVAEQSRLSRGDSTTSLIKDIVFQGGRFISVAEGIDTEKKGWELLVVFSGIHHARSNKDTAERVRAGKEGPRDGWEWLRLPSPQASCARIDHDRSKLFELKSDGLWAISPGTRDYLAVVDKAMAEAQDLVASAASNNDADERARRHAEVLLGAFFHSIGWEVGIRWADGPAEMSIAAH